MNEIRNAGASEDARDSRQASGTDGSGDACRRRANRSRSPGLLVDDDPDDSSSTSELSGGSSTDVPTSPGETVDASSKTCAQCGEPIETSDWYPITSDRDDDGTLKLYPFCTEDCQATWIEARSS